MDPSINLDDLHAALLNWYRVGELLPEYQFNKDTVICLKVGLSVLSHWGYDYDEKLDKFWDL